MKFAKEELPVCAGHKRTETKLEIGNWRKMRESETDLNELKNYFVFW